jgi:5-methylcytosine-specific restriction protein A
VSDARRGTAHQRGYSSAWRKARARFLREHPVCVMCPPAAPPHAATDVDHKIPHGGNQTLFWDETNWQPGCHAAHSAKTARENGGFGNARPMEAAR